MPVRAHTRRHRRRATPRTAAPSRVRARQPATSAREQRAAVSDVAKSRLIGAIRDAGREVRAADERLSHMKGRRRRYCAAYHKNPVAPSYVLCSAKRNPVLRKKTFDRRVGQYRGEERAAERERDEHLASMQQSVLDLVILSHR